MMSPSVDAPTPSPRRPSVTKRRSSLGAHHSDTTLLRRNSISRGPGLQRRNSRGTKAGSRTASRNASRDSSPTHRRSSCDSPDNATPWDAYKRHRSVTYVGKKWDRDEMLTEDQKQYLQDFFHKEACLYGHQVFDHAAKLYDVLKHDLSETNPTVKRQKAEEAKTRLANMPPLDYSSLSEQRSAFRLTFSTLKYQRFLEEMLDDCAFDMKFPEYNDDRSLVEVILCDLKLRKFQLRASIPGETLIPHLSEIEQALYTCKTKLSAALARSRIKACVLTVDHLLPESVRKNDKFAAKMHVSAWVNYSHTNLQEVLDTMNKDGFRQVYPGGRLTGKTFYIDHHCADMLVFPGDFRELLEEHDLIKNFHLVLQDKSSCIGPQSVRWLVNLGDDIFNINVGKGLTMAHLASLTHGSDSVIFGFGIKSEKHFKEVMDTLEKTGCKARCRVFEEKFSDIHFEDDRFKHIKVSLVSADCSRSGVANPIDFIVSEGEDMGILKDLSLGSLDDMRLGELVVEHNTAFRHSMRFPRVQAVVYCTRSLNDAENENVVTQGVEFANQVNGKKKTAFRLAPPVIPLLDEEIEKERPLVGKYLKFLPSCSMSGCFVATVTREADDPKQAAKDILSRAAARGIISGLPADKGKARKSKSSTKIKKEEKPKKKPEKEVKSGRKNSQPLKVSASDPAVRHVSAEVFGSLRGVTTLSRKSVHMLPKHLSAAMQRLAATPSAPHLSPQKPPHQVVIEHSSPFR